MADSSTGDAPNAAPASGAAAGASTSTDTPPPPASSQADKGDGAREQQLAELQGYKTKIEELQQALKNAKAAGGKSKSLEDELSSVRDELSTIRGQLEAEQREKAAALGRERKFKTIEQIVAKVPASHQPHAKTIIRGLADEHGIDLAAEDAASVVADLTKRLQDGYAALFEEPKTGTQISVPKHASVTNGKGAAVQAIGKFNANGDRIA